MGESRSDFGEANGAAGGAGDAARTHESIESDAAASEDGAETLLHRATTVGRYVVLERLGAGAMGVVYAAYDPELDRKVAIKLLRSRAGGNDDRRRLRLQREAQAIAKLSHANVVGIFDVGVHDGQVFLAMEHLPGGTLRQWLASEKRSWRAILESFVEIGRGLSAAHVEGLVHRDFKPDNVLLDRQGKPKVVDFGLVRLSSALDESTATLDRRTEEIAPPEAPVVAPSSGALAADLTRTGALTGTPAYMAPEQFLGQPVSASSDQFAYCVALYEALYGVRPFAGETVIALADAVLEHRITPPPTGASVPPWIRRALEQGLAVKPEARFPTMAELVRRLDRRPPTLKRIGAVGGVALAAAVVLVAVTAVVGGRARARAELEATIARNVDEARRHEDAAREKRTLAERAQTEAAHLFDEGSGFLPGGATRQSWQRAEAAWARALEAEAAAQSEYSLAGAALEAALFVDPKRSEVRDDLIGLLDARLTLAEGMYHRDLQTELEGRLRGLISAVGKSRAAAHDEAHLAFATGGRDLRISIAPYVPDSVPGRLRLGDAREVHGEIALPAGSYLATFSADGQHVVRLPVLLRRGQHLTVTPDLPRWSAIPDGFVFVHAGESLIGSNEENLRAGLDMPAMHALSMPSFVIGRFEVTIADYIRWLDTLPVAERMRRTPKVQSEGSSIELRPVTDGHWTLVLQPTAHRRYLAAWGQRVRYATRTEHSFQDWRRFPVTGVSFDDAQAFARWLDASTQVRGAHVCRDEEWERAARGADGRIYANGWRLSPSEANIDLTYGGMDDAFGPDEVGSHPGSASPFDVQDMEGNVTEMVAASRWNEVTAMRSGSWSQELVVQRLDSRFRNVPSLRVPQLGFRICAPGVVEQ